MAATYDPALTTAVDWVRSLIGDTVVQPLTKAALQDETILAVLAAEPNVWFAAAQCGELAFARWQQAGGGVIEKTVGDLRISRGDGTTASAAYRGHLQTLRARGAEAMSPAPYSFKII